MKKIVLIVSVAISQLAFSQSLFQLKRYENKYPVESKYLQDLNLQGRIKKLIGPQRYQVLQQKFQVEGTIFLRSNKLVTSGCEQHNCDWTNFIVVVDTLTDKLYIGYRIEGKVSLFGEDRNYPRELSEFQLNKIW